jgi:hypothetical protein
VGWAGWGWGWGWGWAAWLHGCLAAARGAARCAAAGTLLHCAAATPRPGPPRRRRRDQQLRTAAEEAAEAARPAAIKSLQLQTHSHGVFAWPAGQPKAGSMAQLVYNLKQGPLRGQPDAIAHVGINGWFESKKEVGWLELGLGLAGAGADAAGLGSAEVQQ